MASREGALDCREFKLPILEIDLKKGSIPEEIPEGEPAMYLVHENRENYRIASTRNGKTFLTSRIEDDEGTMMRVNLKYPTYGKKALMLLNHFYSNLDKKPVSVEKATFINRFFNDELESESATQQPDPSMPLACT
eukprot:Protomagalhaensia_wolfi_Nauph_80__4580@NODE_4712_length_520_cov_20_054054_g3794_i0_p1_GENE_NODE_4712_length_520_cov_20_054054_g3794_i0NODE_4712_length_520_cov_20_054054_g3794_i0_p1_ORF_typecomplete_len157_score34_33_NODE_4712_length_520_cov_20_054054_g3794_i050457